VLMTSRRVNGEGSIYPYPHGYRECVWVTTPSGRSDAPPDGVSVGISTPSTRSACRDGTGGRDGRAPPVAAHPGQQRLVATVGGRELLMPAAVAQTHHRC
jgi:hypothetical protein